MPIYEYQALEPADACPLCRNGFEVIQDIKEEPLSECPECRRTVKKNISWCHSAIMETSEESIAIENKIKGYEQSGMWSHAAELADKHSEEIKDHSLKMRALDNYKKAGYNVNSLDKHAKTENE